MSVVRLAKSDADQVQAQLLCDVANLGGTNGDIPYSKLLYGPDGGPSLVVSTANGLPVQAAAGATWTIGPLPAGDNVIGRVKVTDGTDVASVRPLGTSPALNVAVTDAFGEQITFPDPSILTDGLWQYFANTSAPPQTGQVRLNAANPANATTIWLHKVDDSGVDRRIPLWTAIPPFSLFLRDDAGRAAQYLVTSKTDAVDYVTLAVVFQADTSPSVAAGPCRVTLQALRTEPLQPYTEGDIDASISGVALLWEDAGDSLRTVSAARPLPVNVTGTVSVAEPVTVEQVMAWAVTGTVAATQQGAWSVSVNGPLPAGSNTIGAVTQAGAPWAVSGTVIVQDGGGSLTVDGAVTVSGSIDVTPATPTPADYLPVRLTDGTAFYTATGGGGSGGGTALVDQAAFTVGTTSLTPIGGFFASTPPADLTNGQAGAAQLTAKRALHVNLRDAAGAVLGTAAAPLRIDPTGATAQPVSGTVTALPSGTQTVAGTVTANQGGAWTVTANAGTGTFAVSGTVTANQGAAPWSVTVSGSAAVTALQLPATLGQKAMAASLAVTLASDQSAVPVTGSVALTPAATATTSNVTASATSVTLLAANAARKGATFFNDSPAALYLKLGTTASATSFTVKMFPDTYYELPAGYTGRVDGLWEQATGFVRVTELS